MVALVAGGTGVYTETIAPSPKETLAVVDSYSWMRGPGMDVAFPKRPDYVPIWLNI